MLTSLYSRLSLGFLLLLLCLGGLMLWLAHRSSQNYFLEFTQRLNGPIAMYMANNANLLKDGRPDPIALQQLAPHVMMINPSVEVYLLDARGKLLAHSLDPAVVELAQVDLQPIEQFLSGRRTYPLLGTNPRNRDAPRIFSVHPLQHGNTTVGYVYAVLAGEHHQSLLASLSSSYSFKNLAVLLLLTIVLAAIASVTLFFMLTRRLRALTQRLQRFPQSPGGKAPVRQATVVDEIDQLTTAYENMAQQLFEQYQALEQSDLSRRELFANISHDLRTPLTALQGYLETILLKEEQLTREQQLDYIRTAHRQSKRLRRLVSQLLELSKLTAGELEPEYEIFSVLELAHDTIQDFVIRANHRSIALEVIADSSAHRALNVYADIALIHRVFENLLDNALRFTPAGGRVGIHLRAARGEVEITVADTGSGLDRKEAERVFDRHYSSAQNGSTTTDHAGLGLAIVRSILALHESQITVTSNPGLGSRFRFTLKTPITARAQDVAAA